MLSTQYREIKIFGITDGQTNAHEETGKKLKDSDMLAGIGVNWALEILC